MRNILIASYDMEIGGVERSLAGMLNEFDYDNFKVDLMLYRHKGDFMNLLTNKINLLDEIPQYTSFRLSIIETLKSGWLRIAFARMFSKFRAGLIGKRKRIAEPGYIQQQYMWKYSISFLPEMQQEYDIAISYLWPHYFVAEKVVAKIKVAWIHTDFSIVDTDKELDLQMWLKFDYIIAVSEACKNSFLNKYETLHERVFVIENICSDASIHKLAIEIPLNQCMQTDQRFKLLTVARLSHAKGIDNAVRALKLLVEGGHRQFVWYVVGYGGDEPQIRALINETGLEEHFILLGKQTNPYPYMRACDLYVQPSRYEGKAVTVTEAQILGKPVLITNYATAPSQVKHLTDGYITELSVEGIAQGILRLYEDSALREQLAHTCERTDFGNREELEKLYELVDAERREMACI